MSGKPRYASIEERVAASYVVLDTGCWQWTAAIQGMGYGQVTLTPSKPRRRLLAHRVVYELHRGPIPVGLELDHVCHSNDLTCRDWDRCTHRLCVNPEHLEPVTHAENLRRGRGPELQKIRHALITHCPQGHEFTPENTRRNEGNSRVCRTCCRLKAREAYWRKQVTS